MPFTEDDYLPSVEELTVPELELSSAALRAGGLYFGKYCDNVCKEYMLCVNETKDPRKCINEGKEVTRCGFEFFGKVKGSCEDEFTKYMNCIDHSGTSMDFKNCRKSQAVFDHCMKEKLNVERPPIGHFSLTRLHSTTREKPHVEVNFPEPVPARPSNEELDKRTPKHDGNKIKYPFL